eukprot:TRINITY_DN428_c0_g4_i3.p1 TRINITY_DN428_c0_g4~~TRINITY_DN428_c0_g4_i3.p1  ORF type:complete len:566 (-),score=203.35 TRINITY_DN428_c0_g4_i3:90-1787(-)
MVMSKLAFALPAISFFSSLISSCEGNAFLKKQEYTQQFLNQTAIEARFLKEVRGFVGKEQMDAELPAIQAALEPMFKALPKNAQGALEHGQVKYALHRYFVQRHGWQIDGLDITAAGASDGNGIARQQVPNFMIELFDEAFGNSGLMLHELALFAATLEHLIHDETTDRLHDVYKALSYAADSSITTEQVDEAAKAYMMSMLLGQDKLTPASLPPSFKKLERTYPGWRHTQDWLKEVRANVTEAGSSSFSFDKVEDVVVKVSNRLGGYQDTECRQLKGLLLEAEEGSSGRVKLSDFYKKGMNTHMQFVERPDYLRQLGALDESMSGEPRVIVPNYILSKGSCLAEVGFYSICCINECESLMAHLEREIAAPQASPERIAAVAAKYSTSSSEAPGTFSDTMMRRLKEVAYRNGGSVPLHSRLLAQWLHFAFPRECPFPHAAGSTNPLSPSEWIEVNEVKPNMRLSELESYIEKMENKQQEEGQEASFDGAAASSDDDAAEEALLARWSEEEEILYIPSKPASSVSGFGRAIFAVGMFGVVGVLVTDQARRSGTLETMGIKEKPHSV